MHDAAESIALGECSPLHARITERQCRINRHGGHISCEKCTGLVNIGPCVLPEVNVGANAKKYICIGDGCDKLQVKHNRCFKHNKAFEVSTSAQAERVLKIVESSGKREVKEKTGLDSLLKPAGHFPDAGKMVLDLTADPGLTDNLVYHNITPIDVVRLLRHLVDGELQRVVRL